MRDVMGWLLGVVYVVGFAACGQGHPLAGNLDGTPNDDGSGNAAVLSCMGLPATCGARGDDSCCTSIEMPGGTYDRSYDLAGDTNSGNTRSPATVSRFRLDKYEVSVGRFRAFVRAGMGTRSTPPATMAGAHPGIAASGWDASWNTALVANTVALTEAVKCDAMFQTWTDAPAANENRPMNCFTWYEAAAFCAWDGGYLPTEAEWNYAATGSDQQRAYPWSDPAASLLLDASHASYADGANCVGDGVSGCVVTDLVAVGTKPAGDGRWGHSDLAGNVAEWALDWAAAYINPCTDCAEVAVPSSTRMIRGGNYGQAATSLRTGHRSGIPPVNRDPGVGVRCARAP